MIMFALLPLGSSALSSSSKDGLLCCRERDECIVVRRFVVVSDSAISGLFVAPSHSI